MACRGETLRRTRGKWAPGPRADERARDLMRQGRVALPPAYDHAVLCVTPDPKTGVAGYATDARGRKQIYYTADRVRRREDEREAALLSAVASGAIARGLRAAAADVRRDPLSWDGVRGVAVLLMDRLGVRVGKETHLQANGTRGAATLACENLKDMTVSFRGKSGVQTTRAVPPGDLARGLAALGARCRTPAARLFTDRDGRVVRDRDLGDYVHARFGEGVTPKLLRAWSANEVVLRRLLAGDDLKEAVRAAAAHLNNTPATCRKSYLLRAILEDPAGAVRGVKTPAAALTRLARA